jgi:hypothetical protein
VAAPQISAKEPAAPIESAKQMRTVTMGLMAYASEHGGKLPESIDALVQHGEISADLLDTPMHPAMDGGADYTYRLTQEAVSSFSSEYIVGIDRAAYINGDQHVYVAFADSHVEMLDRETIRVLLGRSLNAGAREDLQIEGAEWIESAGRLMAVGRGLIEYGANHQDKPPSSLKVLIEENLIGIHVFRSPYGPAMDGGAEFAYRLTPQAVSSFESTYIVGLDRAAYVNGRQVVYVLFADSHADALSHERIKAMLDLPINKGARSDLDLE